MNPKRRLPLHHSASSIACFQACPRRYYYAHILRRTPVLKSKALGYGTYVHQALAAWWAPSTPIGKRADIGPYAGAAADAMLDGYRARYGEARVGAPANVNVLFRHPLGEFTIVGEIDALVVDGRNVGIIEHKTSSSDTDVGSDYAVRAGTIDAQVTTYWWAMLLTYPDANISCTYDVLKKPTLQPYLKTENPKYTIPTKKQPVPRLYTGHRLEDESPEEYGARVRKEVEENPTLYYKRHPVVRLDGEIAEWELGTHMTLMTMRAYADVDMWPQVSGACVSPGRRCDYFGVCTGELNIDDESFVSKPRSKFDADQIDAT